MVAGLGDEDAVGVVRYGRDARTELGLTSLCTPGIDARGHALEALSNLTAGGCAAPGDGIPVA